MSRHCNFSSFCPIFIIKVLALGLALNSRIWLTHRNPILQMFFGNSLHSKREGAPHLANWVLFQILAKNLLNWKKAGAHIARQISWFMRAIREMTQPTGKHSMYVAFLFLCIKTLQKITSHTLPPKSTPEHRLLVGDMPDNGQIWSSDTKL